MTKDEILTNKKIMHKIHTGMMATFLLWRKLTNEGRTAKNKQDIENLSADRKALIAEIEKESKLSCVTIDIDPLSNKEGMVANLFGQDWFYSYKVTIGDVAEMLAWDRLCS